MPYGDGFEWKIKRDNSAAWTQRLRARVATETETFAQNILQTAQGTVRVRTGATRDSGQVVQVNETTWAVVFRGAAKFLELGTAHHPAYPFLRPAVTANQKAYLRRLAIATQGRIRAPIVGLAEED